MEILDEGALYKAPKGPVKKVDEETPGGKFMRFLTMNTLKY